MRKIISYLVNSLRWYRLIAAPLLLVLVISNQWLLFKWLLLASFMTDATDGILARSYKVNSERGSMLDSIADDLTIIAAIAGVLAYRPQFIPQHITLVSLLLFFYFFQLILALARYRKMSSFHTYLSKLAAILQGIFLLTFFFLPEVLDWLFLTVSWATITALLEETILVILLPKWRVNVKGIYWLLKYDKRISP
jgi:cardiolipin synthase